MDYALSLPEIGCLTTAIVMATKSSKPGGTNPKLVIETKYSRHFSEAFKKQKVKELCEKTLKIKELCDMYEISRTTVYKWIYLYSPHHERGTKQVIEMESEAHKNRLLNQRIAELERVVGQKQMEIDYYKKLIEIGSEELNLDLKKNYEAKVLSGLGVSAKNTTT